MKVDTLPYKVEELTGNFWTLATKAGRIAIMWDKFMGLVLFKIGH